VAKLLWILEGLLLLVVVVVMTMMTMVMMMMDICKSYMVGATVHCS
jgi:hypothetical protein